MRARHGGRRARGRTGQGRRTGGRRSRGRGGRRLRDLRRGRAAGRATPTAARRASTRSGRPRTTTTPRNSAETIRGCHRSKAAEIHIDVTSPRTSPARARAPTRSPTRAARTSSPGLDFYDDGQGHVGQAKALQQYAATHNVKMVVVLIGANNFGFASVVQRCLTNWLTSPSWWKNYCSDDSAVTSMFTQLLHRAAAHARDRRVPEPEGRDDRAPGTRPARTRWWRRPTPPRSRTAAASATRRPATRASRSAAAASGTATRTGPTRRW